MTGDDARPRGTLATRTLAMPADSNPSGDIFGGWMMAQMDIAGGISAEWLARGRVATVAVRGMEFHEPVAVGDVICCYVEVSRIGNTSITVDVEAWAQRRRDLDHQLVKVTDGQFTYVAIDDTGNKRRVPVNQKQP